MPAERRDDGSRPCTDPTPTASTPLDALLARAAERVTRVTPAQAWTEASAGARLVDVRSADARRRWGVVPGSLHIPFTVLLWRLEPAGGWRTPYVGERDRVILLCDHGCSSLPAAAWLVEMGLDATDVVGGVEAWLAEGLPLAPGDDAPLAAGELPGMRPPA